ncbi:MAG: 1-acyl-sn-glycerol-3-phosphate acyltransferase [Myxococcales bacterium]|nr:1-acyl-sn-glycerol-3-phosphate acyltransferase [Myxococcales bacterium]
MPLRERAHVVWSIVAGWSFTFVFCAAVIVSAIVTLGRCWRWLTPLQVRFWSRVLLGIQRVRVEYEGLEHLETPGMRVATFNHTSSLDPMLITSLYRRGSTSAIKREVLYIPLVGLAIKLMGFLLIDRKRAGKGQGTLAAAAERMEREKMTVFIAPEGTRSPDGALQPFKSGALRLAMASGAPIVPVVISGAFELWPRDRWAAMPGVVRIRILPPISTAGLTEETLRPFSERLRGIYVEGLGR